MRVSQDVIIKPIVTERSMEGLAVNKYTFKVLTAANKIEIAYAIEDLFGVQVEKVNTMTVRGHEKRQGATKGYTSPWKKAIVTLKKDSKTIEFFDGMI